MQVRKKKLLRSVRASSNLLQRSHVLVEDTGCALSFKRHAENAGANVLQAW